MCNIMTICKSSHFEILKMCVCLSDLENWSCCVPLLRFYGYVSDGCWEDLLRPDRQDEENGADCWQVTWLYKCSFVSDRKVILRGWDLYKGRKRGVWGGGGGGAGCNCKMWALSVSLVCPHFVSLMLNKHTYKNKERLYFSLLWLTI